MTLLTLVLVSTAIGLYLSTNPRYLSRRLRQSAGAACAVAWVPLLGFGILPPPSPEELGGLASLLFFYFALATVWTGMVGAIVAVKET